MNTNDKVDLLYGEYRKKQMEFFESLLSDNYKSYFARNYDRTHYDESIVGCIMGFTISIDKPNRKEKVNETR